MSLGSLGFYVGVWVVMMAAMMFPAVAPRRRSRTTASGSANGLAVRAAVDATALFVAGYLVWTAAGLAACTLIEFVRAIDPAFWPGTRRADT